MRRIHLNNIEIVKKINKEFLKSEDYFQSLLEEGFRVNLLTANEVESIQTDCLLLLAKQTDSVFLNEILSQAKRLQLQGKK